jgi:hypothetical protein
MPDTANESRDVLGRTFLEGSMPKGLNRREFIQLAAAGSALCLGAPPLWAGGKRPGGSKMISPGCRNSKVKVARLYMGSYHGLWPKPELDFQKEIRSYESAFATLKDQLADVDFCVDALITDPDQVKRLNAKLKGVDGILAIHFNIGVSPVLSEILSLGIPTMVFAVPYSGHEWVHWGELRKTPEGSRMDCILSSDLSQLAVAIRPFRAIHHLREAKVLNLTTRDFSNQAKTIKDKFGTEIKRIKLEDVEQAYAAAEDDAAWSEASRWIKEADQVVEPSKEDILKSARLALAFEDILERERATVMTVDCYGTMWDTTIKLPAYPCLGFARLNNMGWGGICESDLSSTLTHILFQGLVGRPGFISDPTVDESNGTIILAHCLGTPKMEGPDKPGAPYKLRTVMERREGVVPQVQMKQGQPVTQAILAGMDTIRYFTGEIVDAPVALSDDRGCRTKISVRVDGDISHLWQNWAHGLHRQTVYGDITRELRWFSRFKDIQLIDEARA